MTRVRSTIAITDTGDGVICTCALDTQVLEGHWTLGKLVAGDGPPTSAQRRAAALMRLAVLDLERLEKIAADAIAGKL